MGVTIRIQFPDARDRTAVVSLTAVTNPVATGHAAVTASAEIAAAHGNPQCDPLRPWGHPPAGKYSLAQRARQRYPYNNEYGWNILMFEPEAGDALAAQANGRGGLLVYSGPEGKDHLMRRTQGGVRLDKTLMDLLTGRFQHEGFITLILEPLRVPAWWQFWKTLPETPLLSATAVTALAAPLDEASILDDMLGNMRSQRAYTGGGGTTDARDTYDKPREREQPRERDSRSDQDTYDNHSRGSSAGSAPQGGGQHSGAGASGGWDNTRTVTGAAAGVAAGVATAAALGAMAQESHSSSSSYESSSSDSGSSSSDSSTSSSSSD